jgi:riboflavin kinase
MIAPDEPRSIGHAEIATLKELTLRGGAEGELVAPIRGLAGELDQSRRQLAGHLRSLEQSGHIERHDGQDPTTIRVTDHGVSTLRRRYHEYVRLFAASSSPTLFGTVVDGAGKGQEFVALDGYQEQFEAALGYTAYPGTLNVELHPDSPDLDAYVDQVRDIRITQWCDGETTYGAATCYPVVLRNGADVSERAYVLEPDRTHHDESVVEVIAPVKLRESLGVDSGSELLLEATATRDTTG